MHAAQAAAGRLFPARPARTPALQCIRPASRAGLWPHARAPSTVCSCAAPRHMRSTACHDGARPAGALSQSSGTTPSAEAPGPPPSARILRGRHHLPPCAGGPRRPRDRRGPGAWPADAARPPRTAAEAASATPPLHTGSRSAARPPAAVSPLVRTRPARGDRGTGRHACCTGRCTRRTRAAAPGLGTPHRREEVATDGLDQPPLRADCTSATARTASQGQLLPRTGTLQRTLAPPLDKVPRTAPSPADAPPLRPRPALRRRTRAPHRDTREGRTHAHGRRPLLEEDHRPPPALRAPLQRHGPAAPAARGRTPEAPRPVPNPVETRAPRLRLAIRRARSPARGGTGGSRPRQPVRRAPPSQPRRGRQRPAPHAVPVCLATTLLRWRPASLPPPCREGPPRPDRDIPLQNGQDGRPGHAGPHPGTWRRVCIVCLPYLVCPPPSPNTQPRPKAPLAAHRCPAPGAPRAAACPEAGRRPLWPRPRRNPLRARGLGRPGRALPLRWEAGNRIARSTCRTSK